MSITRAVRAQLSIGVFCANGASKPAFRTLKEPQPSRLDGDSLRGDSGFFGQCWIVHNGLLVGPPSIQP